RRRLQAPRPAPHHDSTLASELARVRHATVTRARPRSLARPRRAAKRHATVTGTASSTARAPRETSHEVRRVTRRDTSILTRARTRDGARLLRTVPSERTLPSAFVCARRDVHEGRVHVRMSCARRARSGECVCDGRVTV